jgi:GWxTD domain-containing protein
MLPLPLRRLVLAVVISCLALPIYSVQAQDQVSPEKRIQHGWLDPNVAEVYKKWLSEEVVFIITDEERVEFKKLATNQQRDAFVVAFWERRNPSPGAPENKFKEEHYRRIAYANTHFAAGIPGWKTDRGHIYITWGAPDKVEHHLRAESESQPSNGGADPAYAYEIWHYKHMEGAGDDISIKFVDICGCGDLRMSIERSDKEILFNHDFM